IQSFGDRSTVYSRNFHNLRICAVFPYSEHTIRGTDIVAPTEAHLAMAAGESGADQHPVSRLQPIHVASRLENYTGAVGARDVRERDIAFARSVCHPEVEVIERGG